MVRYKHYVQGCLPVVLMWRLSFFKMCCISLFSPAHSDPHLFQEHIIRCQSTTEQQRKRWKEKEEKNSPWKILLAASLM